MTQETVAIITPAERSQKGIELVNYKKIGENPWWPEFDNWVAFFEDGTLYISDTMKRSELAATVISKAVRWGANADVNVSVIWSPPGHLTALSNYLGRQETQPVASVKESDAQREVVNIIKEAERLQASDGHLDINETGCTIKYRVHGLVREGYTLAPEFGEAVRSAAFRSCDQASGQTYNPLIDQSGRILLAKLGIESEFETIRGQWFPAANGGAMRLRFQPPLSKYGHLGKLGYTQETLAKLARMRGNTQGVNIACGPTGTGKSTLLAMQCDTQFSELKGEASFLSIEDPVEFRLPFPQRSINASDDRVVRNEAFNKAFMSALRADPDYLLIGEVRDETTAETALRFAGSGHFAWTSLHAETPSRVVPQLLDLRVTSKSIFDPRIISAAVGQRLIGCLCPHCKKPLKARGDERQDVVGRLKKLGIDTSILFERNENGCDECNFMGVIGRQPTAEVLFFDYDIMDCYRNNDFRGVQEVLKSHKVASMYDDALQRMLNGVFDPRSVERELSSQFRADLFRANFLGEKEVIHEFA